MSKSLWLKAGILIFCSTAGAASTLDQLFEDYARQGAGPFDATVGERLWNRTNDGDRRCTTCHTADLRQPGRHVTTGKPIAPMAPSVSADRLGDTQKVEKWFKRNCKWTYGRECSAQEKGDLLQFIAVQ